MESIIMESILEKCVVCGCVELRTSDTWLFLEQKRAYKVTCKCRGERKKTVIGTDQREVIREWNEKMSKAVKEV